MAADEKALWMKRVLGIDIANRAEPKPGARRERIMPIWTDAKDEVDDQLSALRKALRDYGGKIALDVADRGLTAWTGNTLVPMTAVLMDLDAGVSSAKLVEKARSRIAAFRRTTLAHPAIAMLESNPYGVRIAIRRTLAGALDRIETLLEAQA